MKTSICPLHTAVRNERNVCGAGVNSRREARRMDKRERIRSRLKVARKGLRNKVRLSGLIAINSVIGLLKFSHVSKNA